MPRNPRTKLLQFGTEKIRVPKRMIYTNNEGVKSIVSTVNKRGNFTRKENHPSIMIIPRLRNSIHYA